MNLDPPRFNLAAHQRPFVTARQLADFLDVDPRTVVRMIADRAITGVKVGRSWRVPTDHAREVFHVQQIRAS